jgi:hypothetical protein
MYIIANIQLPIKIENNGNQTTLKNLMHIDFSVCDEIDISNRLLYDSVKMTEKFKRLIQNALKMEDNNEEEEDEEDDEDEEDEYDKEEDKKKDENFEIDKKYGGLDQETETETKRGGENKLNSITAYISPNSNKKRNPSRNISFKKSKNKNKNKNNNNRISCKIYNEFIDNISNIL